LTFVLNIIALNKYFLGFSEDEETSFP
jgi:hypothetical protein